MSLSRSSSNTNSGGGRNARANPFGRCLYFTANAVARHVNRMAEAALAPVGLCPSGALLLKLVVEEPGLAPSRAAQVLHLAPSSVTRFADGLERRGFVRREPQGRRVLLFPTSEGEAALEEAAACWETFQADYTSTLGKRRSEAVARDLQEIAEALDRERE